MSKFEVGDIIKGISDYYGITNKDMTKGKVVEADNYRICVKILEHETTPEEIGNTYHVDNSEEYFKLVNQNECIVIYRNANETIALDKSTGKKAVAKCCPEDTYDFKTGAKLAFERLIDDGVREVKRAAKVGEYIKIVNASGNKDDEYKNGDILKVVRINDSWAYYKDERYKYANIEEYVVLENYIPPKEEKPQYYNGKVVCVESNSNRFTGGKIYEVKDGIICSDDSEQFPCGDKIADFEDLKDYFRNGDNGKRDRVFARSRTIRFIELVEE